MIGLVILIIVIILVIVFIAMYNHLVRLNVRINNAWSQIDVQLKRRLDLIPNLVNTVKGYTKHEKSVLENVTKARSSLMNAQTLKQKAEASNMITEALKSVFAVAESYPDLKASKNFLMLQEELAGTESKIAYARQFYNDNVMVLNTAVKTFPSNMVADIFRFKEREFFEAEEAAKKPVKVEF